MLYMQGMPIISESLESSFVRESCFSAIEKTALERWAKVAPDSVGAHEDGFRKEVFWVRVLNIAQLHLPASRPVLCRSFESSNSHDYSISHDLNAR